MSLLTLFGGLKNVFRVKSYTTDTVIFRLHYKVTISSHLQSFRLPCKVTTGLLLACSLLVTAVQLVTDPITCDVKVTADQAKTTSPLPCRVCAGRLGRDLQRVLLDPRHLHAAPPRHRHPARGRHHGHGGGGAGGDIYR